MPTKRDDAIQVRGLEEFEAAMLATARGLVASGSPLIDTYREIAEHAYHYVKSHAPAAYYGPKPAGKGQPAPGAIQRSIKKGAGKTGAWIYAGNDETPHIFIQEFGGTSYWTNLGAGGGRAQNIGHKAVTQSGKNTLDFGNRRVRGHVIYKKPRKPLGYWIWNVNYRLRSYISRELSRGFEDLGRRHRLAIDMSSDCIDGRLLGDGTPPPMK